MVGYVPMDLMSNTKWGMIILTILGWMVQFIVSVRNGDPKQVGYIASGFWAGFTLGRVALADITHYFGERRMVFVYLTLAVALQLLFWLVPNIIVIAVAVFLLGGLSGPGCSMGRLIDQCTGFVIGPFYPIGLYVLTQVVPDDLRIGALGELLFVSRALNICTYLC